MMSCGCDVKKLKKMSPKLKSLTKPCWEHLRQLRNHVEERIFNTGKIAQEGKKKNGNQGVKWKNVGVVKNQKEWLKMEGLTR